MTSLLSSLRTNRLDAVFADYWIAYRIDFESREQVIASALGTERYAAYGEFVRRSPHPAWVFLDNSVADVNFASDLRRMAVPYRRWRTGGFAVYLPSRPLRPEDFRPA
jgi:hypothetical protein